MAATAEECRLPCTSWRPSCPQACTKQRSNRQRNRSRPATCHSHCPLRTTACGPGPQPTSGIEGEADNFIWAKCYCSSNEELSVPSSQHTIINPHLPQSGSAGPAAMPGCRCMGWDGMGWDHGMPGCRCMHGGPSACMPMPMLQQPKPLSLILPPAPAMNLTYCSPHPCFQPGFRCKGGSGVACKATAPSRKSVLPLSQRSWLLGPVTE